MGNFLETLNEQLRADNLPEWDESANKKKSIQDRQYYFAGQRYHYLELQARFAELRKLQDRRWSGSNPLGGVFDKSA